MKIGIDEVIDPEYQKTYKDEREQISRQLYTICNNLLIIGKIVDFPHHLFGAIDSHFWTFTSKAYFDSTVLAFWTLIDDAGYKPPDKAEGKRLTLSGFKGRITRQYMRKDIHPDVRKKLIDDIRDVNFSRGIASLERQLRDVRNKHIAHVDYATKMGIGEQPTEYRISLEHLQSGFELCERYFDVLSLGTKVFFEDWDYAPRPAAKNYYTDIDLLLAGVAKRSNLLRELPNEERESRRAAKIAERSEEDQQLIRLWQQRIKDWGV